MAATYTDRHTHIHLHIHAHTLNRTYTQTRVPAGRGNRTDVETAKTISVLTVSHLATKRLM